MPAKRKTSEELSDLSSAPAVEKAGREDAHGSSACCERKSGCGSKIWAAALLVVAAQIVSTAYFSDMGARRSSEAVTQGVRTFEYEKAGGKENFELLAKAQRLQLKEQLPQIKAFVENAEKGGAATPGDSGATDTASKVMTPDEIAGLQKDTFFAGDEKARILVLEYTDPECPYCIRQAKDNVIPKLLEKFAGKVRASHKVFRAVPHEGAEAKSVAMLCAGKLGGAAAYNGMYDGIMAKSTQSSVMPVSDLLGLAKSLKLDAKKFVACTDEKETVGIYDAYTAEGSKYGVSGTPGTLIVDTETGKYELIAGAYPYESFSAAVEKLLK